MGGASRLVHASKASWGKLSGEQAKISNGIWKHNRNSTKRGRQCCPSVPAEKQLLLTRPPSWVGGSCLDWCQRQCEQRLEDEKEKSEKMWRRYSNPVLISVSDTAKAAWLLPGREEKPTHFAAIKSSGPNLSEKGGRNHCAGQRCDLSIQPEWPQLLLIWKTQQM